MAPTLRCDGWSSAFGVTLPTCGGEDAETLPAREEVKTLLNAHLIEKAFYEVVYELNNRPDGVKMPLKGLLDLLE
jgi:predicted trehalose synthase